MADINALLNEIEAEEQAQDQEQPTSISSPNVPRNAGNNLPLDSGGLFPLQAVDQMIAQRNPVSGSDVLGAFGNTQQTPNVFMRAGKGLLNTGALVGQRAEAAIANPMLVAQRGRPQDAFNAFLQGIRGEKTGELGDVLRSTGALPNPISAGLGLSAALFSPVKAAQKANKMLRGVSKATDKGILTAGKQILKGTNDGVKAVGSRVDEAYRPINKIVVERTDDITTSVRRLPDALQDDIAIELGVENLDDYMTNMDMGKARRLKQVIAEYRKHAFGKGERGAVESVIDKDINRAYGSIKRSMQESLEKRGLSGRARSLLDADDAFTEISRAQKIIRKNLVDSTLLKPTKGGKFIKKVSEDVAETTIRDSLQTIRNASSGARKQIDIAMRELDKFHSAQKFKSAVGEVGRNLGIGISSGVGAGIVFRQLNKGE